MEENLDEQIVRQLIRGERPEGMDYKEFRIKRKAIQKFLKNRRYARGKV